MEPTSSNLIVWPEQLPKALFTDEDLEILERSGLERHGDERHYWFQSDFGLWEDNIYRRKYWDVFQDVIRRSKGSIEEIVIEAFCVMDFRDYLVVRITKSGIQIGSSDDILERMQHGRWE